MNLHNATVIKDSQIVGYTLLQRPRGIILHEGALSSTVQNLLNYWKKEEKRFIVGSHRYNYYYGPPTDPALIQDPVFIFILMLFPLATK